MATLFGKEPTRRDIMTALLQGVIPVNTVDQLAALSDPERLALETIVLSPIISRFIQGFDQDAFIANLDILPLERPRDLVGRAFHAYVAQLKTTSEKLLRAQAKGELGDPKRTAWTRLFAQRFQNDVAILSPIQSAYEVVGGETIKVIEHHNPGKELSITQWAEELHGARKILTNIASLRKVDSDEVVRPMRRAGELPFHVSRMSNGYGLDLHDLVPVDSRRGRGCPLNATDPEGAPNISTSLLLAVHQKFTDTLQAIGTKTSR